MLFMQSQNIACAVYYSVDSTEIHSFNYPILLLSLSIAMNNSTIRLDNETEITAILFGKPKKKLKLNNDNEPISQQATTQEDDKIKVGPTPSDHSQAAKDSSVLDVAAAEVIVTDCCTKSSSSSNENLGVANKDEVIVKTSFDELNDTDTTQSKESNDSDSSSSSDDDEDNHVDNDKDDHAPTSDITASPYQKSEYELLRERNIARNNARLKALGLMVGPSDTSANNRTKQRRRIKAAKVTNKPAVVEPARRSSRLSGIKMNYTDDSGQDGTSIQNKAVVDEEEIQEEEHFKVSPLFDYQMNDGGTSSTVFSEPDCQVSSDGKIKTLVPSGKRLVPPAGLNAIYSLQFYNSNETTSSSSTAATSSSPWLVGAGKSGLIAVWDCSNASMTTQEDQIDYVEPVLSWKGHGGRWIADARFVPSLDSTNSRIPSRLVTAGNDGTVCHWDLSTTSLTTGAPRLLHQTKKSLHSSGIFSMDVKAQQQDCLIVTGSKDKSIAVSKLSQLANDEGPSWRSRFHTGKVACVSFSSSTINPLIASASDDGLVAIHDMRISSSDTVACLEDSHFRPHSAVWKPSSDSIFLTAGLDDVIKLWDLRKTGEPIMSMHGHVPTSGKRLKRIHRPTFLNKGSDSFILSGGENSHAISMFHVDEEKTNTRTELFSVTSRGKLPDGSGDVGSMAVHSNNQVAVTVEGGEVVILSPQS